MAMDEQAEGRAGRERAEEAEEAERLRWHEVARRAMDAAVPVVVAALRAAGWELVDEDLIGDNPYLHPLDRGLGFRVPDGGDELAVGMLFEIYSRTAVALSRAAQALEDEDNGDC